MPICEADPWRFQYFENIPCPDDVFISTEDADSWTWFPAHRWIYDKLAVALSQGLDAAPHGVMPPSFPVFSKPITNLRGMGTGSQVIASEADYKTLLTAGHFWCTLLTGAHVSSDAALVDGEVKWWRHTTGATTDGGTFDYWHIHAGAMPEIESWCGDWARTHLRGYTGMANFETIGGRIIEGHLRFADQWPDLYGPNWVEAVIDLYSTGAWTYPDTGASGWVQRRSVPAAWPALPPSGPGRMSATSVRAMAGVSSVQITFHEDKDPSHHAMPPGGFRVAIVNATSARGRAGRDAKSCAARSFSASGISES